MRSHSIRHILIFSFVMLWLVAAPWSVATASDQKPGKKKQPPPYALIFGTVWDSNGHAVHGVPIKIRRADQNKAKWRLVSDRRGEFAQRVPAGTADYIVWADIKPKKGQKDAQPIESKVHIDNDERVDVGLHLTE